MRIRLLQGGGENFPRVFYGIIGGPPRACIAAMFAALMQRSYLYLLGFIAQAILVIVAVFWGPFTIIIYSDPDVAVTGATSVLDALAVTFAGFFAVPSGYVAVAPAAVLLLTFTNAIGKLAVASLTALLVMKISKVPNNIVASTRALIHKRKGKWTISVRLGTMHFQMIHNISIRMYCYADDGNSMSIACLPAGGFSENGGATLAGPEPWNIRHVVDDKSPLAFVDFDGGIEPVKKALGEGVDLFVQGFDATTGRSVGLHRHYLWEHEEYPNLGHIVFAPEGSMADAITKMSPEQQQSGPPSNANKRWGIDWRGFNALKLRPGAEPI